MLFLCLPLDGVARICGGFSLVCVFAGGWFLVWCPSWRFRFVVGLV